MNKDGGRDRDDRYIETFIHSILIANIYNIYILNNNTKHICILYMHIFSKGCCYNNSNLIKLIHLKGVFDISRFWRKLCDKT